MLRTFMPSTIRGGRGVKLLLLALIIASAALLASTNQTNAQSCQATEDLGALSSHQTIKRIGLLHSSSCRFEGVRYYDWYWFELTGAGEVQITVISSDFQERVALNTAGGEFLASANPGWTYPARLVRTLPAGRYRAIAVSNGTEDAGSYTLTIKTGQLAAPPPPRLPAGLSLELSVEGKPDNTVAANGDSFAIAASLVYDGPAQGPHSLSNIILRVSGTHGWDASGRSRLDVNSQSVRCTFVGGQVRCPLSLVSNGQRAEITIPQGTPPGPFTVSAEASVGGVRLTDALAITIAPMSPATGEGQKTPPADTETIRGRVIARIHPLPENDQRGNYRIEFGFLSEGVLSSGTDRTAVVAANAHLLPSRRYLNEAALLARAQANDRRWLRSSPVDVFPLTGDDANLESEPLLTGRVIARWNSTTEDRVRIEFGFLPDWAFEAAGDDTDLAVELYSGRLPTPGRFLAENRINSETARSAPRWLASSLVEIEAEPEPEPADLEDDDSMGAGDEPIDRVDSGSEPPPVPASNYFRCGSDSIKVYLLNMTNGSKQWLNMTGDEATAIFGSDWWKSIGRMSQSDCDRIPTGPYLTAADYGESPYIIEVYDYFRCGSDTIRVYQANMTNGSKQWLNMTGDEATAIFGSDWWKSIGRMSQSDCDQIPTGPNLTAADYSS